MHTQHQFSHRPGLIGRLRARLHDAIQPDTGNGDLLPHCLSPGSSYPEDEPPAGLPTRAPLSEAGIYVTLTRNKIRVSPSVYNDMSDVERLLEVLCRA